MTNYFQIDLKIGTPLIMLYPHEPSKKNANIMREAAKHLSKLADEYDPRENIIRKIK